MHCDQMEELIAAYADGELQGEQKKAVEAHLAECPHCADLYREYLAMNEALAACEEHAPEHLCDQVMQAIHQQNAAPAKEPTGIKLGRAAGWIGIGVAAMLCVSVATTALVRHMARMGDDVDSAPEGTTVVETYPEGMTEIPTVEDTTVVETYPEETTEIPSVEDTMVEEPYPEETTEIPSVEDTTVVEPYPEETTEIPSVEDTTVVETYPEGTTELETEVSVDGQPEQTELSPTQPEQDETASASASDSPAEPVPEELAAKGWLGRIFEAIGDFLARLWQGLLRLLGGGRYD